MKILSIDELAIELKLFIDTGIESQKLKEHKAAMLLNETINLNNKRFFQEYSSMYEKARVLERKDDIEGALAIYLKILYRYIPEGSVYYERPCILLEKLKRYDEAIELCNLAIARIDKHNLHFPKDDFEKRLDRLIKKRNKL